MTTSFRSRAQHAADRFGEAAEDSWLVALVARLIFIGLIGIALKLFVVNLTPYLVLLNQNAIAPSGTPIIGWAQDALAALIFGTGAVLAWTLVNGGQIFWLFILADKAAWRGAMRTAREDAQQLDGNASRPGYRRSRPVRRAERHVGKMPFLFIAWSGYVALGCFVIDLIVNLRCYPVIKDLGRFFAGMAIGDFSPIDTNHLLTLVVSLFSTEIMAVLLMVVGHWIASRNKGLADD